jgi:hypothetical protein
MRLTFFQEVLLATAAGLAVLLMLELSFLTPGSSIPDSRLAIEPLLKPSDAGDEEQLGFALPPRKTLHAFVDRPLFERSRRAQGASAAMQDQFSGIVDITLVGTVIAMTETIAILQAGGANPIRARVGDTVGGWRVLQIRQDGVFLSNNQSEVWVSTGTARN